MLLSGDEAGRTQQGNNNAYCQDNDISWMHWDQVDNDLLAFTQKLIHLRLAHPAFCRRRWFRGQPVEDTVVEDIAWFLPEGTEMTQENWDTGFARSLAIYLNGLGLRSTGPEGEKITDDSFYIMLNAHHEPLDFQLPAEAYGDKWEVVLDTASDAGQGDTHSYPAGSIMKIGGRSVVVLIFKEAKG